MRVSPQWFKAWQERLDGAIKGTDLTLLDTSVDAEDLSLEIVDVEARIQNLEALRDRLRIIVRTHSGSVSELIEAEKELAKVQTELDAARSSLALMKKRVVSVTLHLGYKSGGLTDPDTIYNPVFDALESFARSFMESVGWLIRFLAFGLPFAVVCIPAFIFSRKWLRSRKAEKAPKNGA